MAMRGGVGGSLLYFLMCQWNLVEGEEKNLTQVLRRNNRAVFRLLAKMEA